VADMKHPPPPPAPAKGATGPTAPDRSGRIQVPLHSSGAIISLLVAGTGVELSLPPKNVIRVGRASTVDVRLPDGVVSTLVSREHVELIRQGSESGTWLQVVDLGSTHGTSFKQGRERDFAVRAGERFRIADVELIVLDKSLSALRRSLGGFFGYSNYRTLDDHLTLGTEDEPLLLLGARGSERGHLAEAIHQSSRRRGQPFVAIPDPTADGTTLTRYLNQARHGTIYVALDRLGPRAPLGKLVSLLFESGSDVRVIFAARDLDAVCDLLAQAAPFVRRVNVPLVGSWRADVPALLDTMLEHDFASTHRVAELPADRVVALRSYHWPGNRIEVRQAANRLHAYLAHDRNMTAAAAAIGEDYETYRTALKRVGIR